MGILIKTLVLLTLLISCGKREPLTQLGEMGEFTFDQTGKMLEKVIRTPRIIGRKLLGIENDVDKLEERDSYLKNQIDNLVLDVNELYSLIDNLETNQDSLEQSISLFNARITELETNDSIVEFIDPCGDNPNQFDEVLMVTSGGNYIAYFQQGNRRFLTVLPNGNYMTTDRQECRFSIVNGEYQE
jgi:prefoldin subunit 5